MNQPLRKRICFLPSSVHSILYLLNALHLAYFGSTGRFHYFAAISQWAHTAPYMGVTRNDFQAAIIVSLLGNFYLCLKKFVKEKFRIEFMEEAADFLGSLDDKSKEKVLFNTWKARITNDKEIFKKLKGEIWEFRILYRKTYFRFLAFWDKADKQDTLVISTHGFVKKTGKVPNSEIEKAERLRKKYFKNKKKGKS